MYSAPPCYHALATKPCLHAYMTNFILFLTLVWSCKSSTIICYTDHLTVRVTRSSYVGLLSNCFLMPIVSCCLHDQTTLPFRLCSKLALDVVVSDSCSRGWWVWLHVFEMISLPFFLYIIIFLEELGAPVAPTLCWLFISVKSHLSYMTASALVQCALNTRFMKWAWYILSSV